MTGKPHCETCQGNRMIARVFHSRPWIRWIPCPRCEGKWKPQEGDGVRQ